MSGSGADGLSRFHEAQEGAFDRALSEVSRGAKRDHWMWFIFPQLKGLGFSFMSEYYGIGGKKEAKAYLADPVLCQRLHRICDALLDQPIRDAEEVFGSIDAMKLRSSMTLFDVLEPCGVFADVLDNFYGGERDPLTLELLEKGEMENVR